MNIQTLTTDELIQIKRKRSIRRMLARKSHFWFFSIYLGHYITYPFASFHHEMFSITEDEESKIAALIAFRGSGKSTLMSLSCPIWAVIGNLHKKFVLIFTQTQLQAKMVLDNIKKELETNEVMKADIGPFETPHDEWSSVSIVLNRCNARMMVASTEQSVRGLRYSQFRPDLIILDDVEDLANVKTHELRNKLFNWYTGDIRSLNTNAKIVIVGTRIDPDDLYSRIIKKIKEEKLAGVYRIYPIVNADGEPSWPGTHADKKAIERERSKYADEIAWQRECMLRFIPDKYQLVQSEWISFYDQLPSDQADDFNYIATAIDLAISEKESADYTAMVSAMVFGYGESLKIYILANPVNERLNFPQAFDRARTLSKILGNGIYTKLFIEDVGYQRALIQHLIMNNVPAEGVKVSGQDKRSRIALVTHLIQQSKVKFPRKGAEELIHQLTGFGIEKHDDLADAFSLLLLKILEKDDPGPQMFIF